MCVKQYIGVDMAKTTFDACFDDDLPVKTFPNTNAGLSRFFQSITRQQGQNKEPTTTTIIGIESTSVYHLLLCMRAKEKEYTVKLINPLITNKYSQRSIRKTKTDAIDARLIRYCVKENEGYAFIETPETILLKQLVREREYLAKLKQTISLRQASAQFKEEAIQQGMYTVNGDILALIEQKMKETEKLLRHNRPQEQKLLQTIPGAGSLTSAACVSEIQDITRFPKSKQLIAFIGIDPKVHQSGSSIDKYRRISKRGNTILRTRLYNAATVAVLHPNQFRDYFQKKRSEGKPYRVALVATMNKMARVIHAVWTHNTPYQEPTR